MPLDMCVEAPAFNNTMVYNLVREGKRLDQFKLEKARLPGVPGSNAQSRIVPFFNQHHAAGNEPFPGVA